MKNFTRSVGGKITVFILCILFLVISVGGGIGIFFMWDGGVYTLPIEDFRRLYEDNLIISDVDDCLHAYFTAGQTELPDVGTSLRFALYDNENTLLAISDRASITKLSSAGSFTLYVDADANDSGIFGVSPDEYKEGLYIFRAYVEETAGVTDKYTLYNKAVDLVYSLKYAIYPIVLVLLFFAVICFVILMCASARRPDSDDLYPGPLNRIPIDLLIAALIGVCICLFWLACDVFYVSETILDISIGGLLLFYVCAALGVCMSIAARIKEGTLLTNTVIWFLCKLFWRILRGIGHGIAAFFRWVVRTAAIIPIVWKACLIFAAITIVEFFVLMISYYEEGMIVVLWMVEKLLLFPAVIYLSYMLKKLQKGGEMLAKGDLSEQLDLKHLVWDFKKHGENLNSIADGMNSAVEQRMKSERMKTELITNVSHDIKTPLTSIINYSDLISKEECDNQKVKDYASVLLRQSERLKRLIEDLVEASKASTGNLDVELFPCEAGVMLTQISGEYDDKLKASRLSLIAYQPDRPIRIMADGRRMIRVFDNLMNNICKYSLPGTRVYISLTEEAGKAVFTFKNTSRDALNVSPDELMERFVRGDSSRSTEGNGLGLSIARSLTELQGGEFDLSIDGDLFKVTLKFPIIQ